MGKNIIVLLQYIQMRKNSLSWPDIGAPRIDYQCPTLIPRTDQ
jgi:hypothetical protein